MNHNNVDIGCFSEIFTSHKTARRNLIGYNIIEKTRSDGYGGVAVVLKKEIKFQKLNFMSDYDILIVRTKNCKPNITICSVYFPHSIATDPFREEIVKLFSYLENMGNVLILGDFNARARIWGDTVQSCRGNNLQKIISEFNFLILNDGSYTFQNEIGSAGGSVLDLSFTNSSLFFDWKVDPIRVGGSHHFPILIDTLSVSLLATKFGSKKKLMENLKDIDLEPNFEDIHETLREEIDAATYVLRGKRTPKAWWDESLSKMYRLVRIAFKKCRVTPSPQNFEALQEIRKEWKKKVKDAKKQSFNNKIEDLNLAPTTREAWRIVKAMRGDYKRSNDTMWSRENDKDYLLLLKTQVPPSDIAHPINREISPVNELAITFEELHEVLFSKNRDSAGGVDQITYKMLRALSHSALNDVKTALNNAFLSNQIPDRWRTIKAYCLDSCFPQVHQSMH
ncbi:PREDICTED: uncharacterized protein LOC108373152 [Rhagoletis zephyria]|uniref:uncharacterized protein LOC108373152 n=1 Tax=Rhagoletis zephyria TaxID=28612 RepID=UPI0008113A83|nr:PREDICTED: uncharacterized protein LOC108373152 [Rhagoletis zephyria]